MATRSIASLSLTFGLVSIPIRLYSAIGSTSAVKFKLTGPGGARVRQTYAADALPVALAEPAPAPLLAPPPSLARASASARAGNSSVVDMPVRMRTLAEQIRSSSRRLFHGPKWSGAVSSRRVSSSSSRRRS